jgi:ADP-heptose:LPS heptosyltransferase
MLIISPYAKPLLNSKQNPKNYPYWKELIELIGNKDHIVQIGVEGEEQLVDDFRKNLNLLELRTLLYESWNWISVDSFFQHFAWHWNKSGIVLWSVSDPKIFGHPENQNLLKDRSYLAKNQFLWWDFTEYNKEAFVFPEVVVECLYKSSR